jgi:hypothetical protein
VNEVIEKTFSDYSFSKVDSTRQREVSVVFFKVGKEMQAGVQLGNWGDHDVTNPFIAAVKPGAVDENTIEFTLRKEIGISGLKSVTPIAECHTHPDFGKNPQLGVLPSGADFNANLKERGWMNSVNPNFKSFIKSQDALIIYGGRKW